MAGTINLSLTQQLDEFGEPLSGGALYIIQAGTVATPQNAYQDTNLTIALPNPIPLDAAGRIPQFFLADGQIKVRLQDRYGVVKFVADNLLVIGPSTTTGGGGGGGVDPSTVLSTGDIKVRYDTAILTGFVRCNGLTIGNTLSSATELADPTAQALFQFLWTIDSTLVVAPGGRGATAVADWNANKTIALPDFRGRPPVGLSGMGNSDSNRFVGVTFAHGTALVLGSYGGANQKTILNANMPTHSHVINLRDPGHAHSYTLASAAYTSAGGGTSVAVNLSTASTTSSATGITIGTNAGINDNTTTSVGSSTAMDWSTPFMLITVYIKL
jgi:microcystin-dependent protein